MNPIVFFFSFFFYHSLGSMVRAVDKDSNKLGPGDIALKHDG